MRIKNCRALSLCLAIYLCLSVLGLNAYALSLDNNNNTFEYGGRTYTISNGDMVIFNGLEYQFEDGTLFREENGVLSIFALPIEQNRITDPELLAYLETTPAVGTGNSLALAASTGIAPTAIKQDVVLKTESVPNNSLQAITPIISIKRDYEFTKLKCTSFQLLKSRTLKVQCAYRDFTGTWYTTTQKEHSFLLPNYVRHINMGITDVLAWTMYSEKGTGFTWSVINSDLE